MLDDYSNNSNTMYSQKTGERKVNDIIHGFISFPEDIWKFVDTPEFQRLRHIKQLGATSYVFPCATHSRFEHSLGTAYLCQEYIKLLIAKHPLLYPEQDCKDAIRTVTLAGLFHDIGHGPFSHMFDNQFITKLWKLPDNKWKHETLSTVIFEKLVIKNQLEALLPMKLRKRIVALILGEPKDHTERLWEF